jgi:hypothetical protein
MKHLLKSCIVNGTFELSYGTAPTSRTASATTTSTMEKRQSTRTLQQRIKSKDRILVQA